MSTRVVVFIGTRPEAIKMAPVIAAIGRSSSLEALVVSTGQHKQMLDQVVELFEIPVHTKLDVMEPGQTLASLSARLMVAIDSWLDRERPDIALVQGDTTTVLMASLACFYRQIPIGHVEAGLRTRNLYSPFPEEANRKLTTSLASMHFAPTEAARNNLLDEGVDESTVFVTGNTVIDALQIEIGRQDAELVRNEINQHMESVIGQDWMVVPFVLITGHRRENFGRGFEEICRSIKDLAIRFPDRRFIYPVHLNPKVQKPVFEVLTSVPNVRLIPPQDYRMFVALMAQCDLILTDSGGVQEEAPSLGKPVLVMRDTTERPEGVEAGTVKLVGTDHASIVKEVSSLLNNKDAYLSMSRASNPYGDGKAAPRIIRGIEAIPQKM